MLKHLFCFYPIFIFIQYSHLKMFQTMNVSIILHMIQVYHMAYSLSKYITVRSARSSLRDYKFTGHLLNSGLNQEQVSKQTIQECLTCS